MIPRACELAVIESLVWHDLRATFGTRLGEAGLMPSPSRRLWVTRTCELHSVTSGQLN